MPTLRLSLFGTPRLERDGQSVPLARSKALALLAYLAATGRPHEREALAALLWPELDADSARNGLRRELSTLRAALGPELLASDRRSVARAPAAPLWLDVEEFAARVAGAEAHGHPPGDLCAACAAALGEAVALHAGEFMAGLTLPDCPEFDEWQFFQREGHRGRLALALQRLGAWHEGRGEHEAAIDMARRWLQLDQLHEPAHRELMRRYAAAGRVSAALRQFRECARLLEAELGAAPEPETAALAEAIRSRQLAPRAAEPQGAASPPAPAAPGGPARPTQACRPLPLPPNPLLGRGQELGNLQLYVDTAHARLITLVGPGGIGKTRLVVELAARNAGRFADGVAFAALQPVASADLLLAAVAEAVGCRLSGSESPRVQLLSHLRDRRLLLVLDNFEHLLAPADGAPGGGAELVGAMLAAAPGLRVLATSREVLNLQEEWSYPLGGLAVPPEGEAPAAVAGYAAVGLFAERAQRARPAFDLGDELAAVARICRLVEGAPLAIELAAAWTAALDCGVIADEIARSLAFLVARRRDQPDRHRSLRAVFDSSWELLEPAAQRVFAGLSVFRGGFTADAAAGVTGATSADLATLADKSLLRLERGGRYQIHELLRQFAAERLAAAPDEATRARRAHRAYYLRFLAERDEAVSNGHDGAQIAQIAAELENVRLAWRHAIDAGEAVSIGRGINTLANFYLYRGPYAEGIAAYELVIAALRGAPASQERDMLLAEALHEQAWLHMNCGNLAAGRAGFAATDAIYQGLGVLPPPTGRVCDPRAGLAMVALLEGDYAEAGRLTEAYMPLGELEGYGAVRPFAWYLVGRLALAQGLYARARQAAERAYAAVRVERDRWFEAYILIDLGRVAAAEGRHPEARHHFQASYAIREEFDDPEGKALALVYEGVAALRLGEPAEADALFARGLSLYRSRGDRRGLAEAHVGQATARLALGAEDEAARHLREALALAREVRLVPLILAAMVCASELLLRRGRPRLAGELLALALRHPAAERETSDQAQGLLLAYEGELVAGDGWGGPATPLAEALEAAGAALLVELATAEPNPPTSAPGTP